MRKEIGFRYLSEVIIILDYLEIVRVNYTVKFMI